MSAKRFSAHPRFYAHLPRSAQRSLHYNAAGAHPPPPPVLNGHNPRNVNNPTSQYFQSSRILTGGGEQQQSSQSNHNSGGGGTLALTTASPYHAKSQGSQSGNPIVGTSSSIGLLSTSTVHAQEKSESANRSHRRSGAGIKYQMDVGAYGIPKRPASTSNTRSEDWEKDTLSHAVNVGEDAYFIRPDAVGVADGVGGWSKLVKGKSKAPSPSALFAKRLMHYCASEIEEYYDSQIEEPPLPPPPIKEHSYGYGYPFLSPYESLLSSAPSSLYPFLSPPPPPPLPNEPDNFDLESQLSEQLEELEDGLDILMILERAYQKTLKEHVEEVPVAAKDAAANSRPGSPELATSAAASTSWFNLPPMFDMPPSPSPLTTTQPLMAGSSTVLIAVLDHVPKHHPSPSSHATQPQPQPSPTPQVQVRINDREELEAVMKVAHIGDCMGMLVRGDEIVWRSEEMWWSFNTPVQLGHSSPATPSAHAKTFVVPVQEDDILIIASDGLSDNLWDEDVLEEVSRLRKGGWLGSSNDSSKSDNTPHPLLLRRTLAGILSEALCSRARRTSTLHCKSSTRPIPQQIDEGDTPFARRARECGREFSGGKKDDISVVVAVISRVDGDLSNDMSGLELGSADH
ncbi:hypothetical protein VNI00_015295 [Paramarasmius palmivorus]|uniref:Protein phosphatase n=1 Tax=Paramarasmius palmivorus TaxID=297713 RepID=A0AAW0BNF5_9AGAR